MTDKFVEGALFAFIVYIAMYAVLHKPSVERVCMVVGNPGSYVCEER